MPRALIGVLPDRQFHLEEGHAQRAERCHVRTVEPTQDKQVRIAFQLIVERQSETVMPVYALTAHLHKTQRLIGHVLHHHGQISKPEQLGAPVLQQDVDCGVFQVPPEMLNRAFHAGKLPLPVPFLNPYHRAPTSFVGLQEP